MTRSPYDDRSAQYQVLCRICGAARYEECTMALCYSHYLDYQVLKYRAKEAWRKAGLPARRVGRPRKEATP